jgi:hypothetical protein
VNTHAVTTLFTGLYFFFSIKQDKEPTKDLVVYLVDASPKMFGPATADVR